MKKKIAHIITDLDIGGAEVMLLKTLRNFKSDEYEHFVVSLKPMGSVGRTMRDEGFRVYALGLNKYNFVPSFARLLYIFKKEKPCIIHSYLFHADIFGRIAAKLINIPILISSLRSVELGGRLRGTLLKMTDFCVEAVTTVSEEVARVHIAKGTAKKEKVRVIHNGVELKGYRRDGSFSLKRKMGIEDGAFALLTVGRLEEVKGHIFLIKALELLRKRGYIFKALIVGRKDYKDKLQKEIVDRSLEDKVILTGERKDVHELLAIADAFVLPSLWEGLPNVLLEAMAAGLPVVATRVGGIPELITDNETGLLVEAKDNDALAEAIERMIKEPGLRERLGHNAGDYVRKNFDIKRTVSETEELYRELLREHEKD